MDIIRELYQIEQKKQIKKATRFQLKINQYCGLIRHTKWQQWLHKTAPEINQEVQAFLKRNNSCKKNKDKMIEIHKSLTEKGKMPDLIEFLKEEFPHMLKVV